MLKRRINLKNELIATPWDSLKKYLTRWWLFRSALKDEDDGNSHPKEAGRNRSELGSNRVRSGGGGGGGGGSAVACIEADLRDQMLVGNA